MANLQLFDMMMQYEEGNLSEAEMLEMFQLLIDNGMVWSLQGMYGRTAKTLIEFGYCRPAMSQLN